MISESSSMIAAKRLSIAIVLAGAFLVPTLSYAQDADTLFKEGRALLDAKKYDEACPKLAESQRLDPGAGTLLALSLCHEGQGKTATAHDELKQAAALGRSKGRPELANAADKRAAAMEPKLAKLVVRLPKGERDRYDVTLDGTKLNGDRLETPFAVDPGEHKIEASAAGKLSKSYVVRLNAAGVIEVVIEKLDDAAVAAPVVAPAPRKEPSATRQPSLVLTTEPPADADSRPGGGQRALGIITMVAGTGALVAGGVFIAKGVSEKSAADRICSGVTTCNENAEQEGIARAKESTMIGAISGAAGTGALMIGAIIYFTAPSKAESKEPKKASARVVPLTSPNQLGLGLTGTF
jgi:hypothetical protein